MKIVKQNKVEKLYRKRGTVQNILKDTLARNEYTKVIVIGMDKDRFLHLAHSNMMLVEAVGMAEYATSAIMKRLMGDE